MEEINCQVQTQDVGMGRLQDDKRTCRRHAHAHTSVYAHIHTQPHNHTNIVDQVLPLFLSVSCMYAHVCANWPVTIKEATRMSQLP